MHGGVASDLVPVESDGNQGAGEENPRFRAGFFDSMKLIKPIIYLALLP
jgi:hypothetical protein